ncbi:uncharacterized protein G2W53_010060 [Senna tora]|uniref:Uncharacterized protein n=1 Tax=Senna tora TaxID=362788 RepID=A0A835CAX3_9FABA|nr:uncharacterized protein G2W53_010060 [Senna tora]
MPSCFIGNPSGSNGRLGFVIIWEVCQVMSKHILNRKPRLNVKRIQEPQVRTYCRTSESNECVRIVFGNPSGSNARMGLVITWEMRSRCIGKLSGSNARMGLVIALDVCQVMYKQILNGKPRLNLKRIQEPQVATCCRTSESYGCLRVVLEIRVDLKLEWDS